MDKIINLFFEYDTPILSHIEKELDITIQLQHSDEITIEKNENTNKLQ